MVLSQYLNPPIAAGIVCALLIYPIQGHGHFISQRTGTDSWNLLYRSIILILFGGTFVLPAIGLFSPFPVVDSIVGSGVTNFLARLWAVLMILALSLMISPFIIPLPASLLIALGVSGGTCWRESKPIPNIKNILTNIIIVSSRFVCVTFVTIFDNDDSIDVNSLIDRVNSYVDYLEKSKYKNMSNDNVSTLGTLLIIVSVILYFIVESIAALPLLTYSIFNSVTEMRSFVALICIALFFAGFFADPAYPNTGTKKTTERTVSGNNSSSNEKDETFFKTNEYGEIIDEKN